ncbi:MAG TPA: glycogen/starch synthase [Saprospiraceae bacterium]|nr:glycogen/starch synthase [Saprospiraceae bacterium]HND88326.1 glycogen/starch synthase [Saprospiraceae bacterium]
MEKKRLLLIAQELEPYTEGTEVSATVAKLPKLLADGGYELRILMPRYGVVNERRHRLHEVVRLSGMNIIVDDDDYPLLIKVASLPNSRLQVYFLDNEDFFKRKSVFEDENGTAHADNSERAAFFCKGAIETVKKFGWAPDFILCEGFLTSLLPLYLRTAYKTEPIFANANIIYHAYDTPLERVPSDHFVQKAAINNISKNDLAPYVDGDVTSMHKGAAHYSDGVIVGSATLDPDVDYLSVASDKPVLPYKTLEEMPAALLEFLKSYSLSEVA